MSTEKRKTEEWLKRRTWGEYRIVWLFLIILIVSSYLHHKNSSSLYHHNPHRPFVHQRKCRTKKERWLNWVQYTPKNRAILSSKHISRYSSSFSFSHSFHQHHVQTNQKQYYKDKKSNGKKNIQRNFRGLSKTQEKKSKRYAHQENT